MQLVVELLVVAGLIALLLAAVESGRWLAGRHLERGPDHAIDAGTIQGAMLGLLGLLLGFSFAGASSRFVERQELVVADAAAISAAWLRADLLQGDDAQNLRTRLDDYLAHRLRFPAEHGARRNAELAQTVARHDALWSAARSADAPGPELHLAVLESLNTVFEVFEHRVAAAHKHLPLAILVLLVACSLLTLLVIGYAGRLDGQRRSLMTRALALLIAAALLATVDMDHGRLGLIQVSEAPLERLAQERLTEARLNEARLTAGGGTEPRPGTGAEADGMD